MLKFIIASLTVGFKRFWKLYITNIFCIVFIILLFSFLDGSKRQLDYSAVVFTGRINVKLKQEVGNFEEKLLKKFDKSEYVVKRISADVTYRFPKKGAGVGTGSAKLIGMDIDQNPHLVNFITMLDGKYTLDEGEILIPSSLLSKVDIKLGDKVRLSGQTAEKYITTGAYKVAGIYNASNIDISGDPVMLINFSEMKNFYVPFTKNIEYCIYFKDEKISGAIEANYWLYINEIVGDTTLVEDVNLNVLSSGDTLNLSTQFNVFLYILVTLTIIVVLTLVVLVNFSIYLVLSRERNKEMGALLALGVPQWKIGLTYFLEAFFQIVISTFIGVLICCILSYALANNLVGGQLELLMVLLSGTNKIDLFVQFYQIQWAFILICIALVLSQIPIYIKFALNSPINFIQKKG